MFRLTSSQSLKIYNTLRSGTTPDREYSMPLQSTYGLTIHVLYSILRISTSSFYIILIQCMALGHKPIRS